MTRQEIGSVANASTLLVDATALQISQSTTSVAILRLKFPGAEVFPALAREFATVWPTAPNSVSASGDGRILWLAPGEWALLGLPVDALRQRAARACGTTLHHVAEVSEGRVIFDLRGAKARDLLSKGCSLDLHRQVFGPGQCAQTLLQHANVLIDVLQGGHAPHYRLTCDRSVAQWVAAWLADAAIEYADR